MLYHLLVIVIIFHAMWNSSFSNRKIITMLSFNGKFNIFNEDQFIFWSTFMYDMLQNKNLCTALLERVKHHMGLLAFLYLCLCLCDCLCQCVGECVCVCVFACVRASVCAGSVFPCVTAFACVSTWYSPQPPDMAAPVHWEGNGWEHRSRVSPGSRGIGGFEVQLFWEGSLVLRSATRNTEARTWGGFAMWTGNGSRASKR